MDTIATPDRAGCWIDGTWGHYASKRLCEIALEWGWNPDPGDRDAIQHYPNSNPDRVLTLSEDAETWLNGNISAVGYRFDWCDGEFLYAPDDFWSEEV